MVQLQTDRWKMERDERTYAILGAAMEVHRVLGPGHLESVYQEALEIEFELQSIPNAAKPRVGIPYKIRKLKICEICVLCEICVPVFIPDWYLLNNRGGKHET